MTGSKTYLSIITLCIISEYHWSQLHNKKAQMGRLDQKTRVHLLLSTRNTPQHQRQTASQLEEGANTLQADRTKKQARIITLITDKIDVKPTLTRRDRKAYFILIRIARRQDDTAILNYIHTEHRCTGFYNINTTTYKVTH